MSPRSLLVRPSKGTILSGLAGGATHAGLAGVLWLWFGFATRGTTAPFLLYVGLGTLAVGAIPSALWSAERLRSPLLLVVGLFVATAYGTWETSVSQSPTRPRSVRRRSAGTCSAGWSSSGWHSSSARSSSRFVVEGDEATRILPAPDTVYERSSADDR
ncbi:hypothetical protein GJ633_14200 [Halorubrum sp. CBA1125]|uniref:hypothetical protein n=1 Tax=Halorubrum sp. CBA1125 TaxID=2668072 RepID=UPI0012E7F0E6|nr:hypothetical protein [Halorubrum sp. CBA1125]MUW15652.1 hypothetical protein [Halorubrum sp. CBA1125]